MNKSLKRNRPLENPFWLLMGQNSPPRKLPDQVRGLAREACRGVSYVKFLEKKPLLQKSKKICTDKLLEM